MNMPMFRFGLLRTVSHLAFGNYFQCVRKYPKSWDVQGTHEMRVGAWS